MGESLHESDEKDHIGVAERVEGETDLLEFGGASRLLAERLPGDGVQVTDGVAAEVENADAGTPRVCHRLADAEEGVAVQQVAVEHEVLQCEGLAAAQPLEEAVDVVAGETETLQ